jgi:hypothetical protein
VVLLTFVTLDAVTLEAVRLDVVLLVAERFVTGVFTVVFCDAFRVAGFGISAGATVVVTTCVVGTGVAAIVAAIVAAVVVGVVTGGVEVHPALIMTTAITRTSKIEDILIQLM